MGMSFLVCPAAQPLLQGLQVCCLPPGDLRLEPGLGATVGDREPGDRDLGAFWLLKHSERAPAWHSLDSHLPEDPFSHLD